MEQSYFSGLCKRWYGGILVVREWDVPYAYGMEHSYFSGLCMEYTNT